MDHPGMGQTGVVLTQLLSTEDAMSGEDFALVARDKDYEISLPVYWSKRQLPDGEWILYSIRGPETLHIRVYFPPKGDQPTKDPAVVAKSASGVLAGEMTTHDVVQSGWEGTTFSITAIGSSVHQKALLAYRVIATDTKMVVAKHQLTLEGASFSLDGVRTINADPKMDEHRLALLKSLKLR
jgi:hypothetical protein